MDNTHKIKQAITDGKRRGICDKNGNWTASYLRDHCGVRAAQRPPRVCLESTDDIIDRMRRNGIISKIEGNNDG